VATPEEVKEQDYSLNAGRYVGVVIEEDGKTEEEFIESLIQMNEEFLTLTSNAKVVESVISLNMNHLVGEK
jgi:type I restriction enzyme M protein